MGRFDDGWGTRKHGLADLRWLRGVEIADRQPRGGGGGDGIGRYQRGVGGAGSVTKVVS